ncbi:MAG: transposase [Fimbriimonas sp.]
MPLDTTIYPLDKDQLVVRRRSLPHWEQPRGVYFVTFRTADSVAKEIIDDYHEKHDRLVEAYERLHPDNRIDAEREVVRLYCRTMDRALDAGAGACPFSKAAEADLMASALTHFNGERYDLFSWSVMPNHVHAVMRCHDGHSLSSALHSWKSYTATRLNRIRETKGEFWQKEYFDHLIRSEHDLSRFCSYVYRNPVKAGLENWRWTWIAPELET